MNNILLFITLFTIVCANSINLPEDIKEKLLKDTWTCDKNRIIPIKYVNDNFCDCEDGTDEFLTSACSNGYIFCINPHNNTDFIKIGSSKYQDGICDCCDGSDESPSLKCQNHCKSDFNSYVQSLKDKLKLTEKGIELAKDRIKEAPNQYKNLQTQFQQLQQQNKTLYSQLYKLQSQIKRNPEKMSEFTTLQKQYQQLQMQGYQVQQILKHNYGKNYRYYALVTHCYKSRGMDEMEIRGGSFTAEMKIYQYDLCPFNYVLQRHVDSARWDYLMDISRDGYSKRNPNEIVEKPPETFIGSFIGWKNNKMIYLSQDLCPNGKKRVTKVKLICDTQEGIKSVKENGMCVYLIDFITPIVCTQSEVNRLKEELKYFNVDYESEL